MKFLVISRPKHPVPPERSLALIDAFSAWIDKYTAAGKLESTWTFAGTRAGGGIANVNSAEELDAIVSEYPFAAFSDLETYPLVDAKQSIQQLKKYIQAMAQAMSG